MEQTASNVLDSLDPLVRDLWQPQWLVDVDDVMMGITRDDGCYVVLAQTPAGRWRPATHIPVQAARMLCELARG